MFKTGEIIDGKYRIDGPCSDSGGMGDIVYVTAIQNGPEFPIVIKYCRETKDEIVRRLQREVRLLREFTGNSRVVQIIDANLDYEPPYFVMKYYENGDLLTLVSELQGNYALQEKVFAQMIECINELHSTGKYHRDIKPQYFLRDDEKIVVSDFGLSTEIESKTSFTRSSEYWGTHGYLPPEYHQGGFKHADESGDIFMLGKSFYVLLTNRDPLYLVSDEIPEPLFVIIERCCALEKNRRYQTLSALKQSLKSAFDVLLNRVQGPGKAHQILATIKDRLENTRQYKTEEIIGFIQLLPLLDKDERSRLCYELDGELFSILREAPVQSELRKFLDIYRDMVTDWEYGWSYAEVIADYMKILFSGPSVSYADKTLSLELAILAADRQNRFAAMNTCELMIMSINENNLAVHVKEMLAEYRNTFVANIEPSNCKNDVIRNFLSET